VAPAVKRLIYKHEALSSNPNPTKKKNTKTKTKTWPPCVKVKLLLDTS
jgi:hypothetical protein